jgi:uncharacterized membrane protein YebE (DUF533 family)
MINLDRILTQVVGNPMGAANVDNNSQVARQHVDGHTDPSEQSTHTPSWGNPTHPTGAANGLLGHAGALGLGAAAGGLAGIMFGSKRMREVAGTALQVGAVAAIGGLAYKTYQNYRSGKPIVPQSVSNLLANAPWQQPTRQGHGSNAQPNMPDIDAFIPPAEQSDKLALLLLRSMVAAAAADGRLDAGEHERIRKQILASDLSFEERNILDSVFAKPSRIEELASAATTPALCAEVYTAARLAIEPDSPVEQQWLDQLAMALNLEPGLRAHLDSIGATQQKAQAA